MNHDWSETERLNERTDQQQCSKCGIVCTWASNADENHEPYLFDYYDKDGNHIETQALEEPACIGE